MREFIQSLKEAGIGDYRSQEDVSTEEVKVYGHVWIVGLEGGDYHAFITELEIGTSIAFGYVCWQANEWGSISLSELAGLPIMLQEIYQGGILLEEVPAYIRIKKQE